MRHDGHFSGRHGASRHFDVTFGAERLVSAVSHEVQLPFFRILDLKFFQRCVRGTTYLLFPPCLTKGTCGIILFTQEHRVATATLPLSLSPSMCRREPTPFDCVLDLQSHNQFSLFFLSRKTPTTPSLSCSFSSKTIRFLPSLSHPTKVSVQEVRESRRAPPLLLSNAVRLPVFWFAPHSSFSASNLLPYSCLHRPCGISIRVSAMPLSCVPHGVA